MSDPYSSVSSGSLKLKGVSDHKIKKKKKKKDKELKQVVENTFKEDGEGLQEGSSSSVVVNRAYVDKRTKAELAFERVKQKRQEEEILEKASKTHKERIMDFNRHLDNLTEHFDIPKVSWTK